MTDYQGEPEELPTTGIDPINFSYGDVDQIAGLGICTREAF